MKKRTSLIAVLLLFAGQVVFGQSLEDAKKDIYYEKFLTAQKQLQQIVSSKPEAEAYYYLGQADIGLEDYDAAKADFTKGLQVDPKSALNMVGMGQVAINEKNYDVALTQFKNAFAQSEGRDFNVVRAILTASSVSFNKDITSYAIDLVGQFKNNKKNRKYEMNAEDFTALGDANANMPNGGGNAASSYENAQALDNKYAASFYKEGILYSRAYQDSLAVQYWNDAINADANYAPAYYRLFAYYRFKDLDKSKQYLDKYVALSDDRYKNMEYESQMYYSQRNYPEAIRVADEILKTNPKPAVSTYKLLAISQNAIGDSLTAKKNMDTYFQKQDTDKIVPADYELFSAILSKLHQDSQANLYVAKAIAKDTTTNLLALRARADQLREDNNFKGASLYYKKILELFKGNESNAVYDY
ncbi:MAG TPA: tetratricopeptide repeat protein, partial [Chitinophagaceae bacterium]